MELTIAAQYMVVKFERDVGMVASSRCLLNVRQGVRKREIQYFYFGRIIFFFFTPDPPKSKEGMDGAEENRS